ncbi:smc domain-containing protein, partial [Lasius niger]
MEILNKAKASLKGSITRIETFALKLSSDISDTELEVKLKKVNQLQLKIDEIREKSFGLDKVPESELKELESDLDQCEIRLEELE